MPIFHETTTHCDIGLVIVFYQRKNSKYIDRQGTESEEHESYLRRKGEMRCSGRVSMRHQPWTFLLKSGILGISSSKLFSFFWIRNSLQIICAWNIELSGWIEICHDNAFELIAISSVATQYLNCIFLTLQCIMSSNIYFWTMILKIL